MDIVSDFFNNLPQISVDSRKTKCDILLSFQEKEVERMTHIINNNHIALNFSGTGTGKTMMAISYCKQNHRKPIIICPKSVIFWWHQCFKKYNLEWYQIVNYETAREGNGYTNELFNQRESNKYVKKRKNNTDSKYNDNYIWNVPRDSMVIFDEAHRAKDPDTENGQLMLSTKQLIDQKIPVLIQSATMAEKPKDIQIPLYLMGFISHPNKISFFLKKMVSSSHIKRPRKRDYDSLQEYQSALESHQSLLIHRLIQTQTIRIDISQIGIQLPVNQIVVGQFILDNYEEIADTYQKIDNLTEKYHNLDSHKKLAKIQKLKQIIEIKKIPIYLEQIKIALSKGKSVIVFLNYLDSLEILSHKLKAKCIIRGSQNIEERNLSINLFQSGKERLIICQMESGGVGINLNDSTGTHPRHVFLEYAESASTFIQVLGRASRVNSASPTIQTIVFVANVKHEYTKMMNLQKKIANISIINNGKK